MPIFTTISAVCQYDQLVRVAASLKNRTAPAHVVLQRLTNSAPSDRVAKALLNLGRIVKTIYIFRYLSDEKLRRRVQRQLNRGEQRHNLARWLFFANRGEFPARRLRRNYVQGELFKFALKRCAGLEHAGDGENL
jgi:TnpA family transposase